MILDFSSIDTHMYIIYLCVFFSRQINLERESRTLMKCKNYHFYGAHHVKTIMYFTIVRAQSRKKKTLQFLSVKLYILQDIFWEKTWTGKKMHFCLETKSRTNYCNAFQANLYFMITNQLRTWMETNCSFALKLNPEQLQCLPGKLYFRIINQLRKPGLEKNWKFCSKTQSSNKMWFLSLLIKLYYTSIEKTWTGKKMQFCSKLNPEKNCHFFQSSYNFIHDHKTGKRNLHAWEKMWNLVISFLWNFAFWGKSLQFWGEIYHLII